MKPAPCRLRADPNRTAWSCSGVLLLCATAILLVACGGAADTTPGGGGGGAGACVTGPAPTALAWDAVTGATSYRIYFDTEAGMNPQFVDVQGGLTTATLTTGLIRGTTYYFAATAFDASNNESNFSNVVCKTIS